MPETEEKNGSTTETEKKTTTTEETSSESKPIEVPDDHPLAKALKATRAELRDARSTLSSVKADLTTASETIASLTTEKEKATDALQTVTGERDHAAATALRFTVAASKGLDLDLADRLKGSTKEELEADAESLLPKLSSAGGFDGGARPSRAPKTEDPSKAHGRFIASILRGGDGSDDEE
jgi:hypothetical protein